MITIYEGITLEKAIPSIGGVTINGDTITIGLDPATADLTPYIGHPVVVSDRIVARLDKVFSAWIEVKYDTQLWEAPTGIEVYTGLTWVYGARSIEIGGAHEVRKAYTATRYRSSNEVLDNYAKWNMIIRTDKIRANQDLYDMLYGEDVFVVYDCEDYAHSVSLITEDLTTMNGKARFNLDFSIGGDKRHT